MRASLRAAEAAFSAMTEAVRPKPYDNGDPLDDPPMEIDDRRLAAVPILLAGASERRLSVHEQLDLQSAVGGRVPERSRASLEQYGDVEIRDGRRVTRTTPGSR